MTLAPPPLAGADILVAEDEYLIARDLAQVLDRAGCARVRTAATLGDAERLLAERTPDVALLDIKLGDQEVYALADQLRASGVAMLFVTGYASAAVPARFAHAPHVEKPFTRERLLHALARAMA